MNYNPIDIRHSILGAPMKEYMRRMGPSEQWTDESVLVAAYVGGLTVAANAGITFSLIQSGYRGNRYFTGLSIGYSSLGYPMPLFNYITPGSTAEKFGSKLGGKVGAKKLGARVAGRLIPGLGWGLLAYDVYDLAVNRSLWGFDFD